MRLAALPLGLTVVMLLSAAADAAVKPSYACPTVKEGRKLAGVSVFDGPPEEMADLVPDQMGGKGARVYATWNISSIFATERKPYLVCRYGEASVSIRLDQPVQRCTWRGGVAACR